jgi:hypothetical protein
LQEEHAQQLSESRKAHHHPTVVIDNGDEEEIANKSFVDNVSPRTIRGGTMSPSLAVSRLDLFEEEQQETLREKRRSLDPIRQEMDINSPLAPTTNSQLQTPSQPARPVNVTDMAPQRLDLSNSPVADVAIKAPTKASDTISPPTQVSKVDLPPTPAANGCCVIS